MQTYIGYAIPVDFCKKHLEGDILLCGNPCNRWHGGMKEAFKKINERVYTTKEGWRIPLEL
ncbi:MAG: hypothetical protein GQ523_08280 [Methanophagales archaeon]|jgi:hypothetical protein|nr:hypothetical protein [Methanophagales archaeon]